MNRLRAWVAVLRVMRVFYVAVIGFITLRILRAPGVPPLIAFGILVIFILVTSHEYWYLKYSAEYEGEIPDV